MTINAFAAKKAKAPLEPFGYDPDQMGPWDVTINISHCGVCYSDIHLIDNDWGVSQYPLVPGHEVVGEIKALGDNVTGLREGMRVGVGWQRGACLSCEQCIKGDENLCSNQAATCVGHHGGFADQIVIDSRFVFPLPENIHSENAAPLLCGGITVYSPLRVFGVTANQSVGVIGIGGLGHMALQFARAIGCEVTAFSTTSEKEDEATHFGAHRFVNSKDGDQLAKMSGKLDFILSTVHADLDWDAYVQILKPGGRLCLVGVPPKPLQVNVFGLIAGQKSICGSPIGNRTRISEMLGFAARHGIQAQTQTKSMSDANAALEIVRANKARYRMVLTR